MILPCEAAVKSLVPALRAMMTRELIDERGMNQNEVAELLGISQSAVSKYIMEQRGHAVEISNTREIKPMIDHMIVLLLSEKKQTCEIASYFCEACALVRKTGTMCVLCQKANPTINIEDCDFCLTPNRKSAHR